MTRATDTSEIGNAAQLRRDFARQADYEERRRREAAARAAESERRQREREAQVEKWRQQDAAEAADRERRSEELRLEQVRQGEARLREDMLAAYLTTPGSTREGFASVWLELLRRHQIEATLAAANPVETTKADLRRLRGRAGAELHERQALPTPVEE
jgi:hypothetical protein